MVRHGAELTGAAVSRRRFVWGAAAGAAGVSAACGGGGGAAPAGVKDQQGKVVFYTRGGDVETRGQQEILIPTFKQAAPNVTVEHAIFAAAGPDETYITKLYAMWSAGEPPDVWGFGGNYFTYWARGLCADLLPLINRDKFDLGQFHKGLPDMFRIKGKQYGLPQLTTFGTLLFYNKNLFDEAAIKPPPVDWEDRSWTMDAALEIARKLVKSPGEPTAVYGLNFGPWMPHTGAWFFGGDAFLPEHYKDSIAPATKLDSAESLAVHQFAQDLRWKQRYAMRAGDASVSQPGKGAFTSGRLAMDLNGGWNFWGYGGVQTDFRWAAAALPVKASNKNPNYNDFWIMAKQSKNVEATWAFMKHLTSAEVQARYSDFTGTPPTNRGALDAWFKKNERIMPRSDLEKVTQGAIDPKRSIESPDHTFLDFTRLDQLYNREIRDPIYRNEGTPREVIAKGKPAYDALVREIYDQWQGKLPA
jgi:multiple sugar transport system substrate-binding protein